MGVGLRLEPIIEMPCMVSAFWRRFAVHLFEGKVTVADMERIEAHSETWHAKIPGKLVEMVVIFPSGAKMTSEERTKMARIIKRWEKDRLASATVILAEGLVGSMHRSVLTGLHMIAPAPHPVKVFGAIADAVRWISPHAQELSGAEATPLALLASIDALRGRFDARPIKAPVTA
jgi:hypothetical protein